jgi:proline dehydrogenase
MDQPDFNNSEIAFQYRNKLDLIKAYNMFYLMKYNWLVKFGTDLTMRALEKGVVLPFSIAMKPTVYKLFCGGPTLEKSIPKIEELNDYGVQTILDFGVEAQENEHGFDETEAEIKKSIHFAHEQKAVPIVVSKFTGLIRFSILKKLHEGEKLNAEEQISFQNSKNRIFSICQLAHDKKVGLFVDAEESWIQNPLDEIAHEMMAQFNVDYPVVFNTVQLYRKDRLAFLKTAHQKAKASGYIYAAKLVRGAYIEKEQKRAAEMGYEDPIQPDKASTDRDYNLAVTYCLENIADMAICIASHNEESCLKAVQQMDEKGLSVNDNRIIFSQLYSMSDHISFNLAKLGYNVAKYMPYGPVREVIPYLVRRAQENTSVSGQMGRELSLLRKEMKRRNLIFF